MGDPKAEAYVPSVQFDLVERVSFHKLESRRNYPDDSRRGVILMLYMKNIPNRELAVDTGVYLCQLVAMLVHPHNTIHTLYKTGEQANCWIDLVFKPETDHVGPVISIRDKYWGDREVETAKRIVKALADRHGWAVEDKSEGLLVQIAKAAAEMD